MLVDLDLDVPETPVVEEEGLNQKEKQKINERLQSLEQRLPSEDAKAAEPRPHGWWARNWQWASIAANCFLALSTIVVAILAIFAPSKLAEKDESFWLKMDQHIAKQLEKPLERLTNLELQMAAMGGQIEGLLRIQGGLAKRVITDVPTTLPDKLNKAAAGEEKEFQSLPVYLVAARSQNVRLPRASFDSIGQRLFAMYGETTTTASWQSVLELLNYRSYLNSVSPAEIKELQLMVWPTRPGDVQFINLTGLSVRVVYRNFHIYYDGASPVTLDTVSFVNCTFYMPPTAKARKVASAILSQGRIDLVIR